ncbi:MAG: guanylate kinase [Luteitalea sp.]|nr:guanylate kinase [Luteitalea sp.]
MSSEASRPPTRPRPRGTLLIVSAPSGTGKTTVVERLVDVLEGVTVSRSYTSRPARAGERDGVDYNFVRRERFEAMVAQGEFLEWADVFGHLYGTRREDTEALVALGQDVVLVIDVQGARQLRRQGFDAVSVFVLPPCYEVLERRLRGRSEDTEDAIRRRLETARREVVEYYDYDYVIVNDDLETCVRALGTIILAERARCTNVRPVAEAVIGTFPGLGDRRTGTG